MMVWRTVDIGVAFNRRTGAAQSLGAQVVREPSTLVEDISDEPATIGRLHEQTQDGVWMSPQEGSARRSERENDAGG